MIIHIFDVWYAEVIEEFKDFDELYELALKGGEV